MIRCLAIDDEPLALELLEDNISKVPYLELVKACDNAIEAISILEQESIDLIFLDIQMPGLTGLQFIESLSVKPMIILVTAYERYALEGFNLAVTDYLLKPVPFDRFLAACSRAKSLFDLKNLQKQPAIAPDYLFINADYSLVKVVIADITYIEGLKDYIRIHLHSSTKPLVARITMKTIESQLPAHLLIRIHKSFIVSINYITSIRKSAVFLGNIELPLSDNYRQALAAVTGKQGL